jgi:hypothetical protein
VTEGEARTALCDFDGVGGLEQWIADQPWQMATDGWTVFTDLNNWRFRLRRVAGGVQISATAPGGEQPVRWIVSGPAVWTGTGANDGE